MNQSVPYGYVKACLACSMIVVAMWASWSRAAVVVFDNTSNEFAWKIGVIYGDSTQNPGTFLDITRPAAEQANERRPGTIGHWYITNISSSEPGFRVFWGETGFQIANTTDWVIIHWNNEVLFQKPTREYLAGESVTPSANWSEFSIYFYHLPYSWDLSKGTPVLSDAAYIGVRKQIEGRWHYGWILFTEQKWPAMWAYETLPDTPIQIPIPAPGVAPALLLAASLAAARRRRGECSGPIVHS